MTDNHREVYREEAYDLLAELESSLLELEERPDDADLVGRVFRALHTIKGSGAMFGFDDIAAFTHDVETVFDLVRDRRIAISKEIIDLALSARDHIRAMLDTSGTAAAPDGSEALLSAFRKLIRHAKSGTPESGHGPENRDEAGPSRDAWEKPEDSRQLTYRIVFRPSPGIFATGTNLSLLLDELRLMGESSVVARAEDIPTLDRLDPEACHMGWDVILTTDRGINAIRDVFIFVEDQAHVGIELIDEGDDGEGGNPDYKRLGDILVERGEVSAGELLRAMEGRKRIGEVLVENKVLPRDVVESALAEQDHVRTRRRRGEGAASGIRVPAEKMDSLVNLVGELVTVQARLSRKAMFQKDPELLSVAEEVERLTSELRDNTMSIRMLPIGSTFNRFKRLVRDLSKELGKEVGVVTEGGETELDKTIIDQLGDPLMHIIRNAIDHGIEKPAVRERLGKPRSGTIRLSAKHSGANVIIRIESDGAGMDFDAIREKAREKGLIPPDAAPSEKELISLLFLPGFSTARRLSEVSGRGVGLDVVKRAIESLSGVIEMESRRNEGVTTVLRLPLTLAIIDSLLVGIGESCFAMPLSAVEECVELKGEELLRARHRHVMGFRDEIIPYLNLSFFFGAKGDPPPIEQVIVSETGEQRIGFGVDRVVGQHQTVIKTLGRIYRDVEGISGATIIGDGTVALILDINKLVQAVEKEEIKGKGERGKKA